MKFSAEKTKNGLGIWRVILDGDAWKNFLENAKQTNINNLEIQGFRKGKVPFNIATKYISKNDILNEATRMAIKKSYKFASLQKTDIQPISEIKPIIKEVSNSKCIVELEFDVKPELKIKKYVGFNLVEPKNTISKKMVQNEILNLRNHYAVLSNKANGKIEKGDIAIIDFIGYIDGKEFAGGKSTNYSLEIGSNQFIAGFEEKLIGKKIKTEHRLKLAFPKNYHISALQSKEVEFKVKIKEIKVKTLPQIDEEFIADLNFKDVKNITDLEKYLKTNLEKNLKSKNYDEFITSLLRKISSDSNIIIPNSMIIEQRKKLFQEFERKVKSKNITIKEYMQKTNLTLNQINAELEKDAQQMLENDLILKEIIKKENISISKNELKSKLNELALQFGLKKDDKNLKKYFSDQQITNILEKEKIIHFLFENNIASKKNLGNSKSAIAPNK